MFSVSSFSFSCPVFQLFSISVNQAWRHVSTSRVATIDVVIPTLSEAEGEESAVPAHKTDSEIRGWGGATETETRN
jgi:hypothetical protein